MVCLLLSTAGYWHNDERVSLYYQGVGRFQADLLGADNVDEDHSVFIHNRARPVDFPQPHVRIRDYSVNGNISISPGAKIPIRAPAS